LFCYQARKWIGSFVAVLGGIETLVFSGGIGENCPSIRTRVCADFEFLGLQLCDESNSRNAPLISTAASKVAVCVIPTDEELQMARSACKVLEQTTNNTES